jgi:tRNA/tmRNA/rRNA uracil-C5-methylase (TrmA/RlmC/RlmD family)
MLECQSTDHSTTQAADTDTTRLEQESCTVIAAKGTTRRKRNLQWIDAEEQADRAATEIVDLVEQDAQRSAGSLTGSNTPLDMHTLSPSIANYIARSVKQVVGIEYVPEAIADAEVNSSLNQISNTRFFAGDIAKVLDDEFVLANGSPDVIITDPPRAGMHEKVIDQILKIAAEKIVYISCNPATQARDLQLLDVKYKVIKIQPVDMFPQTHHVENITLLHKRKI